ncbi:hypothetical protein C8Q80DRAFT_1274607 [Daedaleopsis nitida]|nr:hypothetical protein C8Q80DRAFT_1274607 [Daedaleopsis nitida]
MTGWSKSLLSLLYGAVKGSQDEEDDLEADEAEDFSTDIHADLNLLYELLGVDPTRVHAPILARAAPLILCTLQTECLCCPTHPSLRRVKNHNARTVKVLATDMTWRQAVLFIGHCALCKADYYPDCFTYPSTPGSRKHLQQFEFNAEFLRISKHGIWADRRDEELGDNPVNAAEAHPPPPDMPQPNVGQQQPVPESPRGYVCLAVMDGKTITHQVSVREFLF